MSRRILLIGLAVMFLAPGFRSEQIKIGSINDLTGALSDVGKDAALGIREAVTFNDQGGINGKKIKPPLRLRRVPEAITIYKRFRDTDKIALLFSGAPAIPRLLPTVNKDKMVTIQIHFQAIMRSCKDPGILITALTTQPMPGSAHRLHERSGKEDK
jgi:branched-chain amino acid transport system substrate-binding protein